MKIMNVVTAVIIIMPISAGLITPAHAATPASTINDAIAAMHDEATAYADYQAWSHQADIVPNHTVAVLLNIVATQERHEHFAELAHLTTVVSTSLDNLATTIEGERTEATSLYPAFRNQALADGDTVTAALFAELAGDEVSHQAVATAARRALCGHGPRPTPPAADQVPIVQQPAQTHGQTLINVRSAMRGEAYASARYALFADQAYAEGRPWLGRLFEALATVELNEHYAALANRYGLVGPIGANLSAAIAAETGAITAYDEYADAADAIGNPVAAARFREIGSDEVAHRALFAAQ